MLYFFDQHEKLIGVINKDRVREASREEVINAPDVLRATIKMAKDDQAVYVGHKDVTDGHRFHLYKIHSSKTSETGWTVTGIEAAYDDLSADGYIQDKRPSDQPVGKVLGTLLVGSRWQLGIISSTKSVTTNFYFESRLSCLNKVIEASGIEVSFRLIWGRSGIEGRFVDIYDMIGQDRGKRFVHGSNLLQVIREEKRNTIYTALVGRGKGEEVLDESGTDVSGYGRRILFKDIEWRKKAGDPADKPKGQEFIELPEMTRLFGYPDGKPRVGVVEFTEVDDPKKLLEMTYERLVEVSRPAVQYQATVRDEGDTGLGDTVSIVRQDLGIAYKTRITVREVNLLQPKECRIELGDEIKSYTQQQMANLSQIIAATRSENNAIIETMQRIAADEFWGIDGWNYSLKIGNKYGYPAGIYSFDKPIDQNPTKVICMSAGQLLISNSKRPDGSWNFTTFANGDGMGANLIGSEQIISGAITGYDITAGILHSKDWRNWIDLDKGTAKFTGDIRASNIGNSTWDSHGTYIDNNGYQTTNEQHARTFDFESGYIRSGVKIGSSMNVTNLGIRMDVGGNIAVFERTGDAWLGIYAGDPDVRDNILWCVDNRGQVWGSDLRLKKNFKRADDQSMLSFLRQVPLYNFQYKKDKSGTPMLGVIAQMVKRINSPLTDLVIKKIDNNKSESVLGADYVALSTIGIGAIRALDDKVQKLEQENLELKARLDRLERSLAGGD